MFIIDNIKFEWDKNKEVSNIRKHGVSFLEAMSIFLNEYAILFSDPDHSDDEERFNIIGLSNNSNILIVSHCYREDDSIILIISARKATKSEENDYIELNGGY